MKKLIGLFGGAMIAPLALLNVAFPSTLEQVSNCPVVQGIPRKYLDTPTPYRQPKVNPFGNDVLISNGGNPSLGFDSWATWCGLSGRYQGYPAKFIFKSSDGGLNWNLIGGLYLTDTINYSLRAPNPIAVTRNYITIAYPLVDYTSGYDQYIETYRMPKTGGVGDFATLPPVDSYQPSIVSMGGDNLYLTFTYQYGSQSSERTIEFYRSADGGYTWGGEYSFPLGQGLVTPDIQSIPSPRDKLYLVYTKTVSPLELRFSMSDDYGSTWSTQSLGRYSYSPRICVEPYGIYIAVLVDTTSSGYGTCIYSLDGGSTWDRFKLPVPWTGGRYACDAFWVNFRAAKKVGNRIFFKDAGDDPMGFSSPWSAIDDAGMAYGPEPAVCTDGYTFDGLVAWADERQGSQNLAVYCDNEGWTGVDEENIKGEIIKQPPQSSLKVFPNPMSTSALLSLNSTIVKKTKVEFYDIAGHLVGMLEIPTNRPTAWDGRGYDGRKLPAGVYFLRAKAGDFTATEKVVITR